MGKWLDLNDVLRQATADEADWAAVHAPNVAKAPRGWASVGAPVPLERAELRFHETPKERIMRLTQAGYSAAAIAAAVNVSRSRVQQIRHEERVRLELVHS